MSAWVLVPETLLTCNDRLLHAAGTYIFVGGFLLTRVVLDQRSECASPPAIPYGSYRSGSTRGGCWVPKSFDKAVVILIDALRYDFTVPFVPTSPKPQAQHYHDTLTVLYEQAVNNPQYAFLRPFIADPPTSTTQRLKGLTTGTLPTFIEIGSSFSATGISEDNLIGQLAAAGKNLVHLGDDTWDALFPKEFDMNLTKSGNSFNAHDLHTVDNIVTEHLFPLLQPANYSRWDFLVAHYLGVDHVGHTYGPQHPAMTAKLRQMDDVIRRVMQMIDDKTLLIVMGDHGMDAKGDHGGETADEVESALWMYSRTPSFGRLNQNNIKPPPTAKTNFVDQIDLVPTLSFLLGMPVPFNNLGGPIEEAFVGPYGEDTKALAEANRLTAAQIQRYKQLYIGSTKPDTAATAQSEQLWQAASDAWDQKTKTWKLQVDEWESLSQEYSAYRQETLRVFKSLWARFDVVGMSMGIAVILLTFIVVLVIARGYDGDLCQLSPTLLLRGGLGFATGGITGLILALLVPALGVVRFSLFLGSIACCIAMLFTLWSVKSTMTSILPDSFWGWFCFTTVTFLCVGFGSNSFTIWEDEILLFILSSFGALLLFQSLRTRSSRDRKAAALHAVIFLAAIRLASLSRLCREEQLSNCRTTFPATLSATISSQWQLIIPYAIAIFLPSIIKAYIKQTQPYSGSAPFWIGFAFRMTLLLSAIYWTLDAADGGDWLKVDKEKMKRIRQIVAQLVLMIAAGAGTATFAWQAPLITIGTYLPQPQASSTAPKASNVTSAKASKTLQNTSSTETQPPPKPQIVVQGTANLYGSHFSILPFTVLLLPLLLLSKPAAQGVLALTTIAILSLLELLAIVRHSSEAKGLAYASAVGPTMLALLGHFVFFKTGHQAELSSIQWNAVFIPMSEIRMPWAPIFLVMNTFSGQVLCAAAVPLVVLWRRPYRFTPGSGAETRGSVTFFYPPTAASAASTSVAQPISPNSAQSDASTAATGTTTPTSTTSTTSITTDQSTPPLSPTAHRTLTRRALLTLIARAYLTHLLVYAAINLATTAEVAHLRRHLMVYRIFCPRWMLGAATMLVVEVVGVVVGVGGVRWSVGSGAGLFGW